MLRILHIVSSLRHSSGVMSVLMNYYRHLDREKFQFDFLAFRPEQDTYEWEILAMGGRVYHCPSPAKRQAFRWAINSFFQAHGSEYPLVHCHPVFGAAMVAPAAKRYGVTHVIQHSHTVELGNTPQSSVRNFIVLLLWGHRATEMAACSQAAKGVFFWKDPAQITVIPNVIDLDHFRSDSESRTALRQRLGIGENDMVLGHVGRFVRQKNQRFLLSVFAEYQKENPSAWLLLVGSGPLQTSIQRQAHRLGIAQRVLFLGPQQAMANIYGAMDIFLFPSRCEGLGMVLLEAQAAGLPCIVSQSIPPEAIVGDGVTRLPINHGPGPWLEAMRHITPPQNPWSEACDPDAVCRELEQYYMGLLEKSV